MKKVLLTLCGAVLLMALLTAPALAGPFWQSDLVCDTNTSGAIDAGDTQQGFASILSPSGDLVVSKIFLGPAFAGVIPMCQVVCLGSGASNTKPCSRMFDGSGTLPAQRIKGFATNANLASPGVCTEVSLILFDASGPICVGGFKAP